jgi:hypothetical protein
MYSIAILLFDSTTMSIDLESIRLLISRILLGYNLTN